MCREERKNQIPDVQNWHDERNIPIEKVGVKDVFYPIVVLDKNNREQPTVGRISMYVNLPHNFKGTHMSRFIEILNKYRGLIYVGNIGEILQNMKETLDADSAHMEISFAYFIEKRAPVSGASSLMSYECRFRASHNDYEDFILDVEVPVSTLCPCSKEISDRGAHNQRGVVKVSIKWDREKEDIVWIEDIVELVESCASAPVYSLLKREDEKFVTEMAYERPMFVEDLVREVSVRLKEKESILWFVVEAENFESIHNHNAYARVTFSREK